MDAKTEFQLFLKEHEKEMFQLLEAMVIIQSGSRNKAGVDRVGELIRKRMISLGLRVEIHKQEQLGNHLVAASKGCGSNTKELLLVGHMDTVFPRETNFNFYREDNRHSYGPGVVDMKGGLVVGIYALEALSAAGFLDSMPVRFIFNSDEEIGSPSSGGLIRKAARNSAAAFLLEAGGLDGEIVTGRKGNISAHLGIKGKAGHAAFAGKTKASAILELAEKIIEIEALNDPDSGVSANVGVVAGGIGPNTVPDHAEARLDFRFVVPEDGNQLERAIRRIAGTTKVPGTSANLEIVSGRPPMPRSRENEKLFNMVKQCADSLNIPVKPELRQGVSDANLIADEGVPVLDGLGPIGAKDHSEDEYMVKASLAQRSLLLAAGLESCYRSL